MFKTSQGINDVKLAWQVRKEKAFFLTTGWGGGAHRWKGKRGHAEARHSPVVLLGGRWQRGKTRRRLKRRRRGQEEKRELGPGAAESIFPKGESRRGGEIRKSKIEPGFTGKERRLPVGTSIES